MDKVARWVLGAYYAFVIAFPVLVFAQTQQRMPGPGMPSQIVPCNGVDCTVCHLATLAQNILNTGIFAFIFLSAVLFAYAGFMYVTNEALHKKDSARSIFTNVAGGLIILLSAWLIIDTLMKSVLGGDFGPWNDICRILPN
ncbi:MAG: hypothetical protein WA021_00935 [Minisyncoccia bacterium]